MKQYKKQAPRRDWRKFGVNGPEFVPVTGYRDIEHLQTALCAAARSKGLHLKTQRTIVDGIAGVLAEQKTV